MNIVVKSAVELNGKLIAALQPYFEHSELAGMQITSTLRHTWWIALADDDSLIGFCSAQSGRAVYFSNAFVVPEKRLQGVYRTLFERRLADVLQWSGVTRLYSVCAEETVSMFEQHGFTRIGTRVSGYVAVERLIP
jgi:N-acetylglutamate synthase-like GNAT family acetyltransferase